MTKTSPPERGLASHDGFLFKYVLSCCAATVAESGKYCDCDTAPELPAKMATDVRTYVQRLGSKADTSFTFF